MINSLNTHFISINFRSSKPHAKNNNFDESKFHGKIIEEINIFYEMVRESHVARGPFLFETIYLLSIYFNDILNYNLQRQGDGEHSRYRYCREALQL